MTENVPSFKQVVAALIFFRDGAVLPACRLCLTGLTTACEEAGRVPEKAELGEHDPVGLVWLSHAAHGRQAVWGEALHSVAAGAVCVGAGVGLQELAGPHDAVARARSPQELHGPTTRERATGPRARHAQGRRLLAEG